MLAQPDTAQPLAGQPDRFDALFERFYPELYGLAFRLLGDHGLTEDVLQETFVRLASAAVLQRPDAEAAAWLRRVCLNRCANHIRGERRARERLERAARLDLPLDASERESPQHVVLAEEEQALVRRLLWRLPERQRDCLLLRHSGYSYAEIAAALGIAPGSVGTLLARAERAFRDLYLEATDDLS